MKPLFILLLPFLITACTTMHKPPTAKGPEVLVNSVSTAKMLAHEAGLVLVGNDTDNQQATAQLHTDYRQLFRYPDRLDYARVPGAQLIPRTVIVTFDYASVDFRPTPAQVFQMQQLTAVADRIAIRGRTDGRGNRRANERTAHKRAAAAMRFLLDRGVPPESMTINFQASGHYIRDDQSDQGRNMNRRVEIEFYIDDFTDRHANPFQVTGRCYGSEQNWQVAGEEECID